MNLVSLPLVSVILPFHDNVNEVLRSLNTAIGQSYKNLEILLINDNPKLDITKIRNTAKGKSNIKIINNKKNMGPGFSRNVGLNNANGDYIAFLDSDDEWMDFKIESQINIMLSRNLKASHTSYIRYNSDSKKRTFIKSGIFNCSIPISTFFCRVATPTVIIKKNIISNIRFPEDIRHMEDTILWLRISKKTKFAGLNIFSTIVNVNKETSAFNKLNYSNGMRRIRSEFLSRYSFVSLMHKSYCKLRGI